MKKLVFFIFLLISMLACTPNKPKPTAVCPGFNADCEIQKDWCAVKFLEFMGDSNRFVDAYAEPIKLGHWYLRSNRNSVVFPLSLLSGDYMNHEIDELALQNFEQGNEIAALSDFKKDSMKFEERLLGVSNSDALAPVARVKILCLKNIEMTLRPGFKRNYFVY